MPVLFNDAIDDMPVLDRQAVFAQQRSNARANLLGESECALLQNVSTGSTGVCKSRRGFHYVAALPGSGTVQGAAFFDSSTEYLVVVRGGIIYVLDSTYATVGSSYNNATSNNGSASNRASFAQIADKMFVGTGGANETMVEITISGGVPVFTASTDTMRASRLMVAQNFRLFAVSNVSSATVNNSSIYTSGFLPAAPPVFGAAASFDVGQDYDDITALVAGTDFLLYVFKERSCYAVGTAPKAATGSGPTAEAAFTIRQLSRDIGCVSARTVVQIGNDTFFLSRDGVRTLQRTLADGMTAIQPPISEPINNVIERINWTSADTATAVYRDRKYILALPLDGATAPSHIVVFDTASGGWSMWTGVLPIDLVNVSFGESKLLVVSSETISEYRDYIKESNLVATDHQDIPAPTPIAVGTYGALGAFIFSGLVVGENYTFTLGANETFFSALPNTYYASGSFTATVNYANFTGTPYAPVTGTLTYAPRVSPTLKLISRALTFGEPLNPKTPDYIELEFDRGSNLRLDVSVILDNSDETLVAANLNTGGGSSVLLPVVLPFVLPKGAITRKRISLLGSGLTTLSALDDVNPAREMQVVITQAAGLTGGEAAQSKVLQIRGMVASAFVETLEVME